MNIALWAVQVLLAAAFGMAGYMKISVPIEELVKQMAWVGGSPVWVVRLAGVTGLLGSIGLILPAATQIMPSLTVFAAVGLALQMALAMGLHTMRGELAMLPINLVLGVLAAFVAWGRWAKAPICDREHWKK